MRVTSSSYGKLKLFSWNEDLMKENIEVYKDKGYSLVYLRDELFSTKIGPFRTFTAYLEHPEHIESYNGLTLVTA